MNLQPPPGAELLRRLFRKYPLLGDPGAGPWSVTFRHELDGASASKRLVGTQKLTRAVSSSTADGTWDHPTLGPLLPVYEGCMLNQYDAAARAYVGGRGRGARWHVMPPSKKRVLPRFFIPAADTSVGRDNQLARAAYCEVTRPASERTILAALVPGHTICDHTVPTCRFDTDDPRVRPDSDLSHSRVGVDPDPLPERDLGRRRTTACL